MKYFCMRAEKLPHPIPTMAHDVAYEVSPEKALEMYILVVKSRDMAVAEFMHGDNINCKYWSLWGEDVSDAECFHRKLSGKLGIEILE